MQVYNLKSLEFETINFKTVKLPTIVCYKILYLYIMNVITE